MRPTSRKSGTTKANLVRWALALFLTAVGLLGVRQISLNENVLNLLPSEISRSDLDLLRKLGMINRVYISLEGKDFQSLADSARKVGSALAMDRLFKNVFYGFPAGYQRTLVPLVWPSLPAILSREDMEWIEGKIAPDVLRETLFEDFILLNGPEGLALKSQIQRDPLGLVRLLGSRFASLKGGMKVKVRDGLFVSLDERACLLWAESTLPLTDSVSASRVYDELERVFEKCLAPGVSATVVGTLSHTLANARTIQRDLKKLLPLATIVIVILFWAFTRDLRSLLLVSVPFLSAPLAISFLGWLYNGEVASMALGFGIVLIGISVDFAVHLYMGLSGKRERAKEALVKIRRPILLSYLTTVGVFFVLLFSDVPSHRQMAVLAILGITLSVILAFWLVPGMAAVAPVKRTTSPGSSGSSFSKWLLVLWGGALVAGVWAWPHLKYKGELQSFDATSQGVREEESRFQKRWGLDTRQVFVVARGSTPEQVLDLNDVVYSFLRGYNIANVRSVSPVIPGPRLQAENIQRWERFWSGRIATFQEEFEKAALEIGFAPGAFEPFWTWLEARPVPLDPRAILESHVGGILHSMVRMLPDDRRPEEVLAITLAPESKETWQAIQELPSAEGGVKILSNSKWRNEVEGLLRKDMRRLSLAAGVLIVFLSWLFFRNVSMVAGTLAPVISALSAMAVYTYLTTGELNLMHVLMGIMVIGLSIDYGIFVVCSLRYEYSLHTFRAVALCALSTLSGFGILALAEHPALKALGITVIVGIGAALPTALYVSPGIVSFLKAIHGKPPSR